MTPQQLKNSILQLAIQGKLVEQRKEEGTGEELFKVIQEERNKLIEEGKLKKQKVLPEITEEEIPFDIPENWKWVSISDISNIINGDRGKNYPSKDKLTRKGIPFISAINLDGTTVVEDEKLLCLTDEQYNKLGSGKLEQGDLVLCIRGSIGKHGRYPFKKGAIASSLVILRSYLLNEYLIEYLMIYLDSFLFFSEIKKYDNGTAQPNLSATNLGKFLVPLPPLAEQKRIVEKIEELLPLVERYVKAWARLEELNKKFPLDMKKSILEQAMQGKLVEQRIEEGTGEKLFKIIQEEKQKLIKKGELKKQKSLPEISEEEIPFDLPETWKWVRLGEIVYNHGQKKPDSTFSYIDIGSIDNENQKLNENENVLEAEKAPSRARKIVYMNDVLYATVRPYLHNICIIDKEFVYPPIASTGFAVMACYNNFYNKFLFYHLLSPTFDRYANSTENSKGVAYPAINDERLYKAIIPLPPLAEQKRIVEKIEEILPLCERLNFK